jgi:hypothetical protein
MDFLIKVVLKFTLAFLSLFFSYVCVSFHPGIVLFFSIVSSYLFSESIALFALDRNIVSAGLFLLIVESSIKINDPNLQLVVFWFILFMPCFSIFGIIAESISRYSILDPIEKDFNVEQHFNGYEYFLVRYSTEITINILVCLFIIGMLILMPDYLFYLYMYKKYIYSLSIVGFLVLWFNTFKQAKDWKFILYCISSSAFLYIIFSSLPNTNPTLPIIFGLSFIFESNYKSKTLKVQSTYSPSKHQFYRLEIKNKMSVGVLSGLISSIFIGMPNSLVFKALDHNEDRDEVDTMRDYWVSSSLNRTMGLYLYLFGGMARSGQFDNLSKIELNLEPNFILFALFIMLVIQTYLLFNYPSFYKLFLENLEGVNIIPGQKIISYLKYISFACISIIAMSNTTMNSFEIGLTLAAICLTILFKKEMLNGGKQTHSNLFGLSALPFSNLLV